MKSFLHGKKPLAAEPLRPIAATTPFLPAHGAPPSAAAKPPAAASAHVEVVKEGDKVVRLIVTCVCGERVEIDCLYSAGR